MLSRLTRSASRALHTRPPIPRTQYSFRHIAFAAGCSTVLASYFTYRLTADKHRISLDTEPKVAVKAKPELKPTTPLEPSAEQKPLTTETKDDVPPLESSGESEDGSGGGAYNPETGEINWDCPCLGGMAYGPCGPEFREAFSCFVHSEQDPKGIDCVEKFKGMQTCFRAHPDVYGEDALNDDEDEETPAQEDPKTAETPAPQTHEQLTTKSGDESP